MRRKALRLIDKIFGAGLRRHYEVPSMESSFRNMIRLGFDPRFIIDIGAYNGEWALMARRVFPSARVLMLEAQESKRPLLESLRAADSELDLRIAVMGATEGENVVFHQYENSPTASSLLKDFASTPTNDITAKLQTLDSVLVRGGFPKPDLIKLDVQGYELEVLKGGGLALQNADVVLMEVSVIELYRESPVLADVTAFMAQRNFRTYDICSLLRRPLDNALCQIDMIFVKEDSSYLERKLWC